MELKAYIDLYTDAAFYEDKSGEGMYTGEIRFKNGKNNKLEDKFSIGIIPNSTFAEYITIERTLQKIESYLKTNNIAKNKVEIKIHTDYEVIPRQLNKLIIPPEDIKINKCYGRIVKELSGFYKYSVVWVERKNNFAGKIIETEHKKEKSYKKNLSIQNNENSVGSLLCKMLSIDESELKSMEKGLNKVKNKEKIKKESKEENAQEKLMPKIEYKITLEQLIELDNISYRFFEIIEEIKNK